MLKKNNGVEERRLQFNQNRERRLNKEILSLPRLWKSQTENWTVYQNTNEKSVPTSMKRKQKLVTAAHLQGKFSFGKSSFTRNNAERPKPKTLEQKNRHGFLVEGKAIELKSQRLRPKIAKAPKANMPRPLSRSVSCPRLQSVPCLPKLPCEIQKLFWGNDNRSWQRLSSVSFQSDLSVNSMADPFPLSPRPPSVLTINSDSSLDL